MNTPLSEIENFPVAMATTEGPTHRLVYVNEAFCHLQGKSAEEIIGYPIAEAITGGDAHDVLTLLNGVYGGERSGVVNQMQYSDPDHLQRYRSYMVWGLSAGNRADGLVVQVSDNTTPMVMDETSQTRAQVQDGELRHINEQLVVSAIHQQTLAEIALGSELRLRSLVHGLDAIVCEIDALTGEFTFVSDGAKAFLGYSIERWNEDGFWKKVIHADDFAVASAAFDVAAEIGEDLEYVFRVTAANGSEIWLRNIMTVERGIDGAIVKRRCVMVDVTAQKSDDLALTLESERNRGIAEALQYSMLWQQPEKLFPGLTVAAFYEPAENDVLVGGDFFDAFRLPNGSVMLVVGDVTGKGLKAATRTVEATFALRAFAHDYASPTETVRRLNEFICDFHKDDDDDGGYSLIVLALAVVNPVTGAVQVVSAGAERPLILRGTGAVEEVEVSGLMLGVERKASYTSTDLVLEHGDTFILTTDGITEARQGNVFFGSDNLMDVSRHAAGVGTPHDTGKTILEAARKFSGGVLKDDVCLLLVQRDAVE